MEQPTNKSVRVLISYSHDSPGHHERVLGLSERLRTDGIDARIDQYENGAPAQGWQRWMLDEIDAADYVLTICTETYYRRFRGREEDPESGKGVDFEGTVILQGMYDAKSDTKKYVPVLFADGDYSYIPEPLRSRSHYRLNSEERYQELLDCLREVAGVEPAPLGKGKMRPRRRGAPMTFGAPTPDQRIAPTRLRHGAVHLFGREEELKELDAAWTDPKTHVVTLVAWGGVGKTSLVAKWAAGLAARDYDGADFYDWSFYSQGTRDVGSPSADQFVADALRFFGDVETAESARSPWDKGSRLAQILAERRALLVLDGLEPLQYPPGAMEGRLKDQAIEALLRGLAQKNAGLCVVTTRERVQNLEIYEESTAPCRPLKHLDMEAGKALLKKLGVHGADAEFEEIVADVDGHALTLNLLGGYLRLAHGGDVRRRDRVRLSKASKVQGDHAFRALEAYERWLVQNEDDGEHMLAVLRLLGLFDRPASPECIRALRDRPVIEHLTEPLVDLGEDDWNILLTRLQEHNLLQTERPGGAQAGSQGFQSLDASTHPSPIATDTTIDAHPLIREHFAGRLRRAHPKTWQAAHGRLFDHLCGSAPHHPEGLDALQPLYQAVVHGCLAGRQQEACEVYLDRILRGQERYSTFKLGAIGADLGAVACFFDEPWSRVSSSLAEADQAWLLNEAAFRLRALGRLREAVAPMRAGLGMRKAQEVWKSAAIIAGNLSELELTLGDVSAAVRDAEASVDFADRSGDAFWRMGNRTALADALHQTGCPAEAGERFREAEAMQAKMQPQYLRLYSLAGFRYCDLLLAEAGRVCAGHARTGAELRVEECREVEERAAYALKIVLSGSKNILDIALNHLTLGRARLYRGASEDARGEIEQAVGGLRRAGQSDELPKGLLTRAWLHSALGDADSARADLDEAEEIAERGPMPLFLADIALYRARLFEDREALKKARELVEKHGYGRRLAEIEDLERHFNSKI